MRAIDPTSKTLLDHYANNYKPGGAGELADLILNIMFSVFFGGDHCRRSVILLRRFLRNTMSKETVKMCERGKMPWLRIERGRVADSSKKAIDAVFLQLGGRVFFDFVEPMRTRSKCPRRGYGELVSAPPSNRITAQHRH